MQVIGGPYQSLGDASNSNSSPKFYDPIFQVDYVTGIDRDKIILKIKRPSPPRSNWISFTREMFKQNKREREKEYLLTNLVFLDIETLKAVYWKLEMNNFLKRHCINCLPELQYNMTEQVAIAVVKASVNTHSSPDYSYCLKSFSILLWNWRQIKSDVMLTWTQGTINPW